MNGRLTAKGAELNPQERRASIMFIKFKRIYFYKTLKRKKGPKESMTIADQEGNFISIRNCAIFWHSCISVCVFDLYLDALCIYIYGCIWICLYVFVFLYLYSIHCVSSGQP